MKKIVIALACIIPLGFIQCAAPEEDAKTPWERFMQDDIGHNDDNAEYWQEKFRQVDEHISTAPTNEQRVAWIGVKAELERSHGNAIANGGHFFEIFAFAKKLEVLGQPRSLLTIGATAGIMFGLWHSSSLLRDVVHHTLMLPRLAEKDKTSIRTWSDTIGSFFMDNKRAEVVSRNEVILTPELAQRAEELTKEFSTAVRYNTNFRHCLFYGPPGTGKTMLAQAIAKEAGLEYMYISAAKLSQYSIEEGIRQIVHVFEFARSCEKKLMIILDEADSLFAHREGSSDKILQFLNEVLTYMGTPQNDFIVIALTNRPRSLDPASKNRFGEKLKIDKPNAGQRRDIFALYVKKYLIDASSLIVDKRPFYRKFFTASPEPRPVLTLAPDVMTVETFDELAHASDGLVGRDIADIIQNIQTDAYKMPDLTVSKDMIFATLTRHKDQLRDLDIDFL